MSAEAAYTKLSFLLGNIGDKGNDLQVVRYLLPKNLRGELSRNITPFYEGEYTEQKSKL